MTFETVPLSSVVIVNPRKWSALPSDEDMVSFVPMASVEAETGKLDPSNHRPWDEVRKGYTKFEENDVLFAKITPSMENGKAALALGLAGGRGVGSTEFHVLRPSQDIEGKYLLYFVLQARFRRAARAQMRGVAGQLRVPPEFFGDVELPFPPLDKQKRIVAEIETQFARLDDAVAALERARIRLKRYQASVLKAACEGRLVPTEAELARQEGRDYEPASVLLERISAEWEFNPDKKRGKAKKIPDLDTSELPDLPEGWAWTKLAAIADIKGGITKGQRSKYGEVVREVPYLRVANVQRGYLDLQEVKLIAAPEQKIQDLLLQPGDVLFNEGGDRDKLGRGWIWQGQIAECIHQNHVFRARMVTCQVEPKYVSWYGNTFGQQYFIDQGKQTTNLASINLTKLGGLPVPLPPAAEQKHIVAEVERRLSVIEQMEATVETSLKRAESLRQSILRTAFSGRLVASGQK